MTAKEMREKEVEDIVTKPVFTFDDIEKLDYLEINHISNKYGEDEFNPRDLLDADESDGSETEEILKRFRTKSKQVEAKDVGPLSEMNQDKYNIGDKKYSKPSNYSYQYSQNSNNNLIMNKLYDNTHASQDLTAMTKATRNHLKMGTVGDQRNRPHHADNVSPLYSPLQQHNPKRKIQDRSGKGKIKGDHQLNQQMNMMNAPNSNLPGALNRQSHSMANNNANYGSGP